MQDVPPWEPTPSELATPPPNQRARKQTQRTPSIEREPKSQNEEWTEVTSRASNRLAVMERMREMDCQVFVDFKLPKGQMDEWKSKNG